MYACLLIESIRFLRITLTAVYSSPQLKEGLFKCSWVWLHHLIRVDAGVALGARDSAEMKRREEIVLSR